MNFLGVQSVDIIGRCTYYLLLRPMCFWCIVQHQFKVRSYSTTFFFWCVYVCLFHCNKYLFVFWSYTFHVFSFSLCILVLVFFRCFGVRFKPILLSFVFVIFIPMTLGQQLNILKFSWLNMMTKDGLDTFELVGLLW
jgi:hypothetical protein